MCVALVLGLPSAAVVVDIFCTNTLGDSSLLDAGIARSTPGDAVAIHGTCLANQTICLPGDRSYRGDSRVGTIIRQADRANLPALVASASWCINSVWTDAPMRLSTLTIDARRKTNNGTVALMIRAWQSVVTDLHVTGAASDGIRLSNLAADGVTGLNSTQVNGVISNVFVESSGGSGVRVLDTQNAITDWSLLDSWVASSGESAVLLDNAAGWQVRGLHTYGTQRHAIFANRCFATTISANYIEDMGNEGAPACTYYGVACHAQTSAASIIADNKVFAFRADPDATSTFVYVGISGVASGGGSDGVGVVGVHGNVVRGANRTGDIGLGFAAGAGRLDVSSSGNHVHGVRTKRRVGEGVQLVATF